jgi:DNA-binding MurR/RpiR family transcriptional regulator
MAFKPSIQSSKSMEELKSVIVAKKIILPEKLATLARAMFERPDSVAFASAGTFARECGVSPTTAHRLARVLGFRSFRCLKLLFQNELRRQTKQRTSG